MDEDKIEALFREVLKEIGIEENTEVLKNTPKRIAKSYKECKENSSSSNRSSFLRSDIRDGKRICKRSIKFGSFVVKTSIEDGA